MKKTDEKIVKEIIRLYVDEKMPTTKLGEKFGISSTAVSNIIKRNGIETRNISGSKKGVKRGSKLPVDEIISMYVEESLPSTKISEIIGCSKRSVLNVLRDAGVNARGCHEYDRTSPMTEEIRDQYLSGKSVNKVCELVNMSYSGVRRILDNLDIVRTSDKAKGFQGKDHYFYGSTWTDDRRDKIYLSRTGYVYNDYLNIFPLLVAYRKRVESVTNRQKWKDLPNADKRGKAGVIGAYNLDHRYSIKEGFLNDVDPGIIGNIANLEFIPWEENLKKNKDCSITLEELKNNIYG
jgi:hypothetical protein